MDDQSLAHSRYNCTYHIVFIRNSKKIGTPDSSKEICNNRV